MARDAMPLRCRRRLQPRCTSPILCKSIGHECLSCRVAGELRRGIRWLLPRCRFVVGGGFSRDALLRSCARASGMNASPAESGRIAARARWLLPRCRFVVGGGFSRDALLQSCARASGMNASPTESGRTAARARWLLPRCRFVVGHECLSCRVAGELRRGIRWHMTRCRFVVGGGFSRDALLQSCARASGMNASPAESGRIAARDSMARDALPLRCRRRLQPRCSSPILCKSIGHECLSYRERANCGAGFDGTGRVAASLLGMNASPAESGRIAARDSMAHDALPLRCWACMPILRGTASG